MLKHGGTKKTWVDALVAETATLIEVWSENTIQSHLLRLKRNAKAYKKIVEVLAALDYERSRTSRFS